MRRKKENSPTRQDRGINPVFNQENNNIPKRLVNPEDKENANADPSDWDFWTGRADGLSQAVAILKNINH